MGEEAEQKDSLGAVVMEAGHMHSEGNRGCNSIRGFYDRKMSKVQRKPMEETN